VRSLGEACAASCRRPGAPTAPVRAGQRMAIHRAPHTSTAPRGLDHDIGQSCNGIASVRNRRSVVERRTAQVRPRHPARFHAQGKAHSAMTPRTRATQSGQFCGGRGSCHSRAIVLPANLGAMHAVRANFTSSLLLLALAGCAGQQPQQASAPGPSLAPNDGTVSCSQVVMASWYRGSSRGRTSSQDLVAAHRSLPFGTSIQVTAIETGRTIVVRINDRGPIGRGRIIDLSRVAADQLGMRWDGVARVRLDPVGPDGGGCPFQQAWLY